MAKKYPTIGEGKVTPEKEINWKKSPLEVKLINDVRKCRTCQWFWGATPPYGDFPVFDWQEDFPEKVREQKQTTEPYKVNKGPKGVSVGQGQVDPGVMHGCRKAPIMTIGINPNMTPYWVGPTGAKWGYPNFSHSARYAYYYRHHNVYQESLDPEFIMENIIDGKENRIVAKKNGWIIGYPARSSDHRYVLLTIWYEGEKKPREIEVAWRDDERFVVFKDSSYADGFDPDNNPKFNFLKDEIIGAKINVKEKDDIQLYENATGYYQRYVMVLNEFEKMMGLKENTFSISEDVCQHDMIHCASPGWSDKYDMPRDKMTRNCVSDHAYLLKQLIQTNPAHIVLVGGSALSMFSMLFLPFLKRWDAATKKMVDAREDLFTERNGDWVPKETFHLLRETTDREYFLVIEKGNYKLKARIIIPPHFSYSTNFVDHSRLSGPAWKAFQDDFPHDVKVLETYQYKKGSRYSNRISDTGWDGSVAIAVTQEGPDGSLEEKISRSAWNVLMGYHFSPMNMLASVLKEEVDAKRLTVTEYNGESRLERSKGGCKFCVNDAWTFPEGCPYGQEKKKHVSNETLESVVQFVRRKGKTTVEEHLEMIHESQPVIKDLEN